MLFKGSKGIELLNNCVEHDAEIVNCTLETIVVCISCSRIKRLALAVATPAEQTRCLKDVSNG